MIIINDCSSADTLKIVSWYSDLSIKTITIELAEIAGVDVRIILGERLYNVTNINSVHDDYKVDLKMLLNNREGL